MENNLTDIFLAAFDGFLAAPQQATFCATPNEVGSINMRCGELEARMADMALTLMVDNQVHCTSFRPGAATPDQFTAYNAIRCAIVRALPDDVWRVFVDQLLGDDSVAFTNTREGALRCAFDIRNIRVHRHGVEVAMPRETWTVSRDSATGQQKLRISFYFPWPNPTRKRSGNGFWIDDDIPLTPDQAQAILDAVQTRMERTVAKAVQSSTFMKEHLAALSSK